MSINQATFGSALAKGIQRGASPEREAARAEARAYKAEQDAKLQQVQNTDFAAESQLSNEILQQELLKLKDANRTMRLSQVKQRTFDALDRFSADNDPRHLNRLITDLKENKLPTGPLGDIARVDKLTENDRAELERLGFDADAVLASPEAAATLVRTTNIDGSTMIRSVDKLKGGTGYDYYATTRELEEQKTRAEILNLLHRSSATNAGTKDEREAARIMREKYPELEAGTDDYLDKYNDEYASIVARNRQTAAGKEEDVVDQLVTTIDEKATQKLNADFFSLDMADPNVRRTFERDIEKLERMGKLSLSESEKKQLSQVKQLIAIGNPAAGITEKETGLIDRFSNNVQKFVKDKVDGVEATSAYAAYRNILRNALYGSVLTEGEMKAFRDQFGDLGQQTGPILVQFKTALTQLRGDLQSLIDTNNSYVMHFRMGKDREELQNIIDSLSERIEFFSSNAGDTLAPQQQQQRRSSPTTATPAAPTATQSDSVLDELTLQQLEAIDMEVNQ